jgi:hypothetical protein
MACEIQRIAEGLGGVPTQHNGAQVEDGKPKLFVVYSMVHG